MPERSVPDLHFKIEGAAAERFSVAPLINFKLSITESAEQAVHAVALRCQIRIEPAQRSYQPAEKQQLRDLFGEPARWGQTMRTMLWAHASIVVPPFVGSTSADLPVPCTYDFNVATAKYFHGLADGEVSLAFLFSGTVFYANEDGTLQVCQIPWEKEANFRLSVRVWKEMMELYYPGIAWLALRKDAFDRLNEFKMRHSLPTFEAALEKLLAGGREEVMT